MKANNKSRIPNFQNIAQYVQVPVPVHYLNRHFPTTMPFALPVHDNGEMYFSALLTINGRLERFEKRRQTNLLNHYHWSPAHLQQYFQPRPTVPLQTDLQESKQKNIIRNW
jgi:hypothetical protein